MPGLYCVGEVAGGIHGRNRLMGNALLDILSMGRRAGAKAAGGARGGLMQGAPASATCMRGSAS